MYSKNWYSSQRLKYLFHQRECLKSNWNILYDVLNLRLCVNNMKYIAH